MAGAYPGSETRNRETNSYLMRQNRVNFILTMPLNPQHGWESILDTFAGDVEAKAAKYNRPELTGA